MIWTKGAHHNANFDLTFDCSWKNAPDLCFGRLLKVYKILAKKYRGVISHDPEDWWKIWRKTDLLFQKWQEFSEVWPEHLQVSKTCTFICSCCAKYLMFDLKRYRGWELSLTALKGYAKFEEKLTCGLENDMRNMADFHQEFNKFWPEHSKVSKIFTLMGFFRAKYIFFELKNYRGVIFHDIKEWQGCSQIKREAVYSMGAQTRFGQKKSNFFLFCFVLFLLGTSDKVL